MTRSFRRLWIIAIVIAIAMFSCTKKTEQKPSLNLYVMSHCPFGIRAEDIILSFLGNFNDQLKLHIYYIVSKQGDHNFTSLHGPSELDEDLYQIAIQTLYNNKFYSYLLCYNSTMDRDKCLKDNNINKKEIEAFVKSGQAEKILDEDFKKTEELGINASPTLYINSQRYDGPIQPEHIIRSVCSNITGLSYCKTLKPPVDVHVTLLTGGWDSIYHPNMIKESLGSFFYKATVETIDADTQKGEDIVKRLKLKEVPAIVFSSNITMTTSFNQIKPRLKEADGVYIDTLNDMGYRHLLNTPLEQNKMIMFLDITDKAAINAGISIIRLLMDYKKEQYRPVIKVIGDDTNNDVLKAASIIEHTNKLSLKDKLSVLTKLYSSASLKEFSNSFKHSIEVNERLIKKQILDNNALASRTGVEKARFALLINNTELINASNPSQVVGIFELSPIIGKVAFPSGSQSGKCSK